MYLCFVALSFVTFASSLNCSESWLLMQGVRNVTSNMPMMMPWSLFTIVKGRGSGNVSEVGIALELRN